LGQRSQQHHHLKPIAKPALAPLLVVAPLDKAILDEITTLDLALTELLSVGKPDALGSRTLAR
jgi:hypothetical protein